MANLLTIRTTLLSLALVVYVPCMFISGSHPIGAFSDFLQKPLKSTIGYLGLNVPYRFFAPDPLTDNLWLDANVQYADNSHSVWACPRFTNNMTDLEHQRNMVFYYWQYRMVIEPANKILWPDACKYILRDNQRNNRQPVKITLFKNSQRLNLPYPGSTELLQPPSSETLLEYDLTPAQCSGDKQ